MTLLILGMHRSGTSAITSLIQAMGAYVGAPAELLPATNDNPAGFFERKDTLDANRAIMQHHRCNWYKVEDFDAPTPTLPTTIHAKMDEVVQRLSAHAPYALKDPRFCFTLPYWLPHFSSPPVIVLAIRHPAAIAHSLQLRNAMPIEHGLALWESYMIRALHNIRDLPVIRCQYEALLAQPEAATQSLHAALQPHFPTLKLPTPTLIDPRLTHATQGQIRLTPSQQALYEKMASL